MTTIERLIELYPTMVQTRRHLHMNPELSFQEFKTSEFICNRLSELGIRHTVLASTGVVAHIGQGDKCVALRADIDALPIVEETGLEFASNTSGVMHACGHDMHTTMLLAAAQILKEDESKLNGTVKLVFQPGEEKSPGGASLMIKAGALLDPTPQMMFGQHINPDAVAGELAFVSGPMMASADELYWTIRGRGAHAAQPHKGNDPVLAACGLVNHLQMLTTKHRNPLHAGVMTVTSIHGGSATNIIPDVVEMKGTLRAFNPEWRLQAMEFLSEQTKSYCAIHGCSGSLEIVEGYPPLVNNSEAVEFARSVATKIVDPANVADFEPKMWAEDFSFYTAIVPSCFWMLGGRPSNMDTMPGLHNAKFAPDERSMIHGSALLVETALTFLKAP